MDRKRRVFIQGSGALACAAAAAVLTGDSLAATVTPSAVKLAFVSEGEMPFAPEAPFWVLSPGPPPQNLIDSLPALYGGVIKIVVKQTMANALVNTKVHIVPGPNFAPGAFPFPPSGFIPISDFDVSVSSVTLGKSKDSGKYNFGVLGTVTKVNAPSPFGDLLGRAASFSAEFDGTGPTAFYFSGGFVAGSHTTWVPVAVGRVSVNAPAM